MAFVPLERLAAAKKVRKAGRFQQARKQPAAESLPRRYEQILRGGHINLGNWRRDDWRPALEAAGLAHRKPYALRHAFIREANAVGVPTFEIARLAGTSVLQIEATYGHVLPDAAERATAALDAFDAREVREEACEERRGTGRLTKWPQRLGLSQELTEGSEGGMLS